MPASMPAGGQEAVSPLALPAAGCFGLAATDSNGVGGWGALRGLVLLVVVLTLNQGHRQLYAVLLPAGLACRENGTNSFGDTDCIEISHADQGVLIGPCFTVPFLLAGATGASRGEPGWAPGFSAATLLQRS